MTFTFGGCLGNENKFESEEQCLHVCGNGEQLVTHRKAHAVQGVNFILARVLCRPLSYYITHMTRFKPRP